MAVCRKHVSKELGADSTAVVSMKEMTMGLRFEFAGTRDSGARDHFFHFLIGYLLPSLDRALGSADRDVCFEDCGPVMGATLADACKLMNLNLVPQERSAGFVRVVPSRWDNWLFRLDGSRPPESLVEAFHRATDRVRTAVLHNAAPVAPVGIEEGRYILVLKRSPTHAYYRVGGPASFPGYGSERRHLENEDEIAQLVERAGCPAKLVDMGAFSFAEQVALFRDARAVIGARGAEFAHLFWMKPDAHAFMFATPIPKPNHASRTLAFIRGVRFTEVPVPEEHFEGSIAAVEDWLSTLQAAAG